MDRVEFFKDLGFLEYESKILASLVRISKATPKEISQDSGVPQNKLYQILKVFEKKGLLAKIPGDTKKYQLINLKSYVEKKLKEKEDLLKKLKTNSQKIKELPLTSDTFEFSLIKVQRTIMNKIEEVNEKVEKEILGVQRNWKVWGGGLRAIERVVKKGVSVKLIGVISEKTKKKAEEYKDCGVVIRSYNKKFGEHPLRFSVFDRKVARITIGKPEIQDAKDYITIWSDSKALVNMLVNQFFEMWKAGKKI